MDLETLAQAGDRNLAAAWAMLARHAGSPPPDHPDITLAASGLPIAFFNGAFPHQRCSDPARSIADTIAFFADRSVPYLLWVRDGADDALVEAGRAAGLRDAGGPPAMALPVVADIPAPPDGLAMRIASSPADLADHHAVAVAGFGMPPEVARRFVTEGLLGDPDCAIAIGTIDGVPVTTALLARSGTTAGVYNVATLAEHRGKGFGAAATWAVIAEGAARGCTHSVLQASADGHPVYRRMGFLDVGRYVQLEGPPASSRR